MLLLHLIAFIDIRSTDMKSQKSWVSELSVVEKIWKSNLHWTIARIVKYS